MKYKEFILVGKYIGQVGQINDLEFEDGLVSEFKFRGAFLGSMIKRVFVHSNSEGVFLKNRVYVLHLREIDCDDGVLHAIFLRGRAILI